MFKQINRIQRKWCDWSRKLLVNLMVERYPIEESMCGLQYEVGGSNN